MARKNNRKHYHSRWLPDDLFKLTKKNKVGIAATTTPRAKPTAAPQNITLLREKDTPMETHITHAPAAVSQATLSPRPAKPQGVDDPRITRGSVWFADLAPRTTSNLVTSVQSGTRPVLVISNNLNNRFGTVITIIPFTGAPKRLDMPTHVAVIPTLCPPAQNPQYQFVDIDSWLFGKRAPCYWRLNQRRSR